MNFRSALLAAPLAFLAFTACKNPAADAPAAAVAQAAAPAAAEAPTAGHEALKISAPSSTIGYVGSKVTGSHEGVFERFSGTIHLDPKKVEASRIEVDIDMDSITSDNEKLTGHLKSGDFFLVEQHPKARFVSTSIAPIADAKDGATHTVAGNLTLRGVTREISFPATVTVDAKSVSARSEFSLPRKQFGVAYEGKADDLIRDEVLIKLAVTAPRQTHEAAAHH